MSKNRITKEYFQNIKLDTVADLKQILLDLDEIEKKNVIGKKEDKRILENIKLNLSDKIQSISLDSYNKGMILTSLGSGSYGPGDRLRILENEFIKDNIPLLRETIKRLIREKDLGHAKEILNNIVLLGIKEINTDSFYITKEKEEYYFNNSPIYIKSKNAQYFVIFDTTFSLKQYGGKIQYKDIIEECKKRGFNNIDKKAIQRALTGSSAIFFEQVKEITQKPAFGKSLFVAMQNGKELEFNNKK